MNRAKSIILFTVLYSALPMVASDGAEEKKTQSDIRQYTGLWDRAGRWASAQIAWSRLLSRSVVCANKAERMIEQGGCTPPTSIRHNDTLMWRDTIIRHEARDMLYWHGLSKKDAEDTAARIHWCSDRVGDKKKDHIGDARGHVFVRLKKATVDLRPKDADGRPVDIKIACENESAMRSYLELFPPTERAKIREALAVQVEDLASGKTGKQGILITGLAIVVLGCLKKLRSKA